ncbi:hypothetical protein T4B_11630 [Trichinella pseudospiralis]|uniref:Uncharacterized protein n=2 Tax=Trichinella pseudospiralis TaxID=6337 RepID=A0A0V1EV80_TRIPS|nr:hypothetical protein T4A_13262 [Trichinella pseudospiralis]KRY88002.1 hypothetical protein T4D_11761 [Trichinella pseudospiralis]KRZ30607.1 hypothetical protein T4B_11630 [Trichinella pseudospiralis]KRZ43899.1 hypothetical protein T4C_813 [Trichinella pseudospiralis]
MYRLSIARVQPGDNRHHEQTINQAKTEVQQAACTDKQCVLNQYDHVSSSRHWSGILEPRKCNSRCEARKQRNTKLGTSSTRPTSNFGKQSSRQPTAGGMKSKWAPDFKLDNHAGCSASAGPRFSSEFALFKLTQMAATLKSKVNAKHNTTGMYMPIEM